MKKLLLIGALVASGMSVSAMDNSNLAGKAKGLEKTSEQFVNNARELGKRNFLEYCTGFFSMNSVTAEEMTKELNEFPELLAWQDKNGVPLLYLFANSKNTAVVEVLIRAGANTALIINGKSLADFAKGRDKMLATIKNCELQLEVHRLQNKVDELTPQKGPKGPGNGGSPNQPAPSIMERITNALYRKEAALISVALLGIYWAYRTYKK